MAPRTISKAAAPQIKPEQIRRFHAALHAWYQAHGRHDLPWRNTDDPYRIWLSEVMLQQTQVSTVLARFYQPFLTKFPTVTALADAPRESVMKAWEGLGYYSRARNFHEAAKLIASSRARPGISRNELPLLPTQKEWRSWKEIPGRARDDSLIPNLLALPGIGRNTAHAVAAFAYHHPVAILEANVKRVVARIFALETPSDNALWNGAERLLNQNEPFHYNQAMMDLGSLICTPKAPACTSCPATTICRGKIAPERYPQKKAKKETPTREVIIHVREDAAGRLFLEARDAALLGGLYGFPQTPLGKKPNESIGTVTHVYSHFKLIGHVVLEKLATRSNSRDWYTHEKIATLPLSKLDHKVLALVENCHSPQKKPVKPVRRSKAH